MVEVYRTYDQSLNFLRKTLDTAKVDGGEKRDGMGRLDRFVNAVESRFEPRADFDSIIAHENAISSSVNGRSVFDDKLRVNERQGWLF